MEKTALIIVDLQKGFDDINYWGGNRNNPDTEKNARRILDVWRELRLPIFHIKHNSTNKNSRLVPGQQGNEIKDIVAPQHGEPVIGKTVNSAFIGTDLKDRLDAQQITSVVIVGLQTDHCVSTTVRMAGNYGYNTTVISDATATFDRIGPTGEKFSAEQIHLISLASLNEEFAKVLTTEQLLSSVKSIAI
jgi:nicotinamidase-related amidase